MRPFFVGCREDGGLAAGFVAGGKISYFCDTKMTGYGMGLPGIGGAVRDRLAPGLQTGGDFAALSRVVSAAVGRLDGAERAVALLGAA